MNRPQVDIYAGKDPRHVPAYPIGEAVRYLGIPYATLRSWLVGQSYIVRERPQFFEPVIEIADRGRLLMSFTNLLEAHVLDALRKRHRIPLQRIRVALGNLRARDPERDRPLAEYQFATVGVDLLIEEFGRLIDVTRGDQLVMRDMVRLYMTRVECDEAGLAARFYPFTRTRRSADDPKIVVIDPLVLFGRPVIFGTRIATAPVVERWRAGESFEALAGDYDRPQSDIEEAIRCELAQAA